ncbi:hypothetical protein H9L12_09505 [Sphingomonas rhizophila]|uniref:Uncharacterized protein n=1 Tax=Sphingomonas rhizophila TaxID=2071607 RepID=A0A7G9S9L3_9SPHN|nr:hypothetical protein [Sphingomonas rhizophila]QNN64538.1 hypothetical protein H9L12_09505 [Sphingomonas rhizophila]
MDEQKVLITPDGYGRIAIVRRDDCRYCLYEHWRWDLKTQIAFHVEPVRDRRWTHNDYDREALYEGEGIDPLPGLFATLEDAEREARSLPGFADAIEEAK